MEIRNTVVDLIGNTPLMRLESIEKKYQLKSRLYGKLEYLNATGSIKDRVALKMIMDARDSGLLKDDTVIIEPTSGNTGIGLASIGVGLGYKVIIVMPENFSIERRKLIKAYGAEVVLSAADKGMAGAIEKAHELAEKFSSSFIPDQFNNPSNWKAHYETTGPEIWNDLDGQVDILIAGVGTGGTITGIGKYLKSMNPNVKIIAVEPDSSAVLSGDKPGAHQVQGIGAGFIPSILDRDIIDEIFRVKNEEAIDCAKQFNKTQGVLVGISSGAALYCALQYARQYEDKNIAVILPDSGDRYLSTDLFEV